MLTHPTLDKLQALKLSGMVAALIDQMAMPDIDELAFEERLGLLVDREITERENRRMTSRLRRARLRHNAALEDIDYRNPRGLDKGLIQSLASCQWAKEHLNILITGPTGVGKTWLACALAQKACREGYTAQYIRLSRLLRELMIAKGDGRYPKLLASLAKVDVLLLDDWGLTKLNAENRRDLLEVLEAPTRDPLHHRDQPTADGRKAQGESAKGTSPSAALRTQREPLSSLSSHHPTIGLTPSFQCGNMPGCILAISPSLCSARLLW